MGLKGLTILVTRQKDQASEFVAEIERRGGIAVLLPMIAILDPESWEECDQALQEIKKYDALIFTSANAVEKFLQRCLLKSVEPVAFRRHAVYAVGEKTKRALERRGLIVAAIPPSYSSASLALLFGGTSLKGKRFLFPRGNAGKGDLIKVLVRHGAVVDPVGVYRTVEADDVDSEYVARRLAGGSIDIVTFASPSAVSSFVTLFPAVKMAGIARPKVAVIGPTTQAAALELGLRVDVVAQRSTVEGLLDAIEQYHEQSSV